MDTYPARKAIRTYSRLGKRARVAAEDSEGESSKRLRLDDFQPTTAKPRPPPLSTLSAWLKQPCSSPSLPSTPDFVSSSASIFSDRPEPCFSPPSSPPPLLSTPEPSSHAPNFLDERNAPASSPAFLPMNRSHLLEARREALAPIAGNTMHSAAPTPIRPKSQLVQMQINLGSALQKMCRECGMAYVKSDAADSALHDKYHRQHLDGPDLGKPFRKFAGLRADWRENDAMVVAVDGKNRKFERQKVREVLDIVQTELGAVDIPDEALWAELDSGTVSTGQYRFRAFLYLAGTKCVGLCLAEVISAAYKTCPTSADQDVCISEESSKALVGISRIWTSKSHRQKGVARVLLDTVTQFFDPKGPTTKDLVAFSQPTTSGAKLARRWHEQEFGWLVYVDR